MRKVNILMTQTGENWVRYLAELQSHCVRAAYQDDPIAMRVIEERQRELAVMRGNMLRVHAICHMCKLMEQMNCMSPQDCIAICKRAYNIPELGADEQMRARAGVLHRIVVRSTLRIIDDRNIADLGNDVMCMHEAQGIELKRLQERFIDKIAVFVA